MSLPKEPRQKMINMMYLVLTALLALNVSAEILNAFKTVNNSIGKSNDVIKDKNTLTYKSFADALADPRTHDQAAKWAPKADAVRTMSSNLYDKIEALKQDLKKESGLELKDGKESYREADLDAATRLMDNKKKGAELYNELKSYKQQLLDVLNPAEFADNPLLQKDVADAKANFAKQLPLDLRVPESQSGNTPSSDTVKNWVTNYFHMTPTIAALTILSKFQNDVRNSEAQMSDYLRKKVGEVKIVYDQFQVLAQASSNYVMPGDELDITAGVGAFSAAAKPTITINGQLQPIGADGTANFKTKAEGAGEHTVMVHIQYTKPDGNPATVDKPVKYTVGLPSGASVFLKKMNVVYIGVDNPLTISGGSVGREKVHVSFTSPGASITNTGGDDWVIKPTTPGLADIVVNADGKPFKFPIRVKQLPLPAGFIGTKKGGAISSAEFKAIGGLIARLEDSDFEAPFKVVSYKLGAIGGGISQYTEASNEGNRWSGSAASIVSRATPGTNIFFDQIRVIGPDGKQREITPMVFSLK
ncbi:MAG TPA: gliding motility protein GldM [Puia sp.]|nr:gliding motility protein GldM [Puia sp.]